MMLSTKDHHLWRCPDTITQQKEGWAVAIKNLTKNGKRALARATKKWNEWKDQDEGEGREFTATAPSFKQAADRTVWKEIEKVLGGTESVRDVRRPTGDLAVEVAGSCNGRRRIYTEG